MHGTSWCSIAGSPLLSDTAPRLLFVPVSGAFGKGEYARSLAIAQGAQAHWPDASIHFVLSREAPYAAQTPFATTLLDSSPTFHTGAVIELIERFGPDVVLFDNAGRTAQLRGAKRAGARVVYISARPRQRRKAFRLGWMRLIDEHWIAYPEFIAGALHWMERLKLEIMRRPVVRYLDVILDGRAAPHGSVLAREGLGVDGYVLVVPGGGTGHPGATDAMTVFLGAARGIAAAGTTTVFVGREAGPPEAGSLRLLGVVPQAELAELMRGARLIVVNGGSTLLQSIACGKACVAAAIAGDQAERIKRCTSAGVVLAAPLDTAAMVRAATRLLGDEAELNALAGRTIALGLADGVAVALRAMHGMIAAPQV